MRSCRPPPSSIPWALSLAADEMSPFDDMSTTPMPSADDPRFHERPDSVEWVPNPAAPRYVDTSCAEAPSGSDVSYSPRSPPGPAPPLEDTFATVAMLPPRISPEPEVVDEDMSHNGGAAAAADGCSEEYDVCAPPPTEAVGLDVEMDMSALFDEDSGRIGVWVSTLHH